MFTGITQTVGQVITNESHKKNNQHITIETNTPYFSEATIGDSIMVDGVCLTITHKTDHTAKFGIIRPTYETTIIGDYMMRQSVNLEKAISAGERFDGHFVLGHVDGKAEIVNKQVIDNTILLSFKPKESILMREIVAKGSVAISGVSLTVIEKTSQTFQIGLIPHTQLQTTLSKLTVGHWVNIETDILAKYMTGGQYVG